MMRACWILIAALAVGAVAAGDATLETEHKGKVNIVTVDDDGNRHEHKFEFDGPRPFLGLMLEGGVDEGARVREVIEDSPAERAGLLAGDVILAVQGEPVKRPWDLTVRVLSAKPGDRIDIEVDRAGDRRTLTAELGESDDWVGAFAHGFDHGKLEQHMERLHERLGGMDFQFGFGPMHRPRLGVELTQVTPELREHLGGPADAGVLVGRLMPGMPAEQAGVRVGDLIVAADGEPVRNTGSLLRALRGKNGESIELELIRDGSPLTLNVFIPEREENDRFPGPRA